MERRTITLQEKEEIRKLYSNGFSSGDGSLDLLCKKIKRTKSWVCRKAKLLNLTNKHRNLSTQLIRDISDCAKKRLKEKGHPKGFFGNKHSEESRFIMSQKSKLAWQNPNSILNSPEHRQKLSDRAMIISAKNLKNTNAYSNGKRGTIIIGGKTFFARSSWEANIAAYFQFLKERKEIRDWEHEPETFWFLNIKRGVRSYKPDFKITNKDNSTHFVEVKGWMDNKSKTKLKRMAKYYPEIKMELIQQKDYKSIAKWSGVIKDWGKLDSDEFLAEIKLCSISDCNNKSHSKNLCRKHFYKAFKL